MVQILLFLPFDGAEASASSKGGGDKAATSNKKAKSEDEKREERLAANRRSARESRNRKKQVFEELQRSVQRLAEENGMLRRENDALKIQMIALRRQLGVGENGGEAKEGGDGSAAADQGQLTLEQQQQIAMFQMQQMMAMNPAFFAQMQPAQQPAGAAPLGDNADAAGGDDSKVV